MDQLPYDDVQLLKQVFMRTMSVTNTDRQVGEQIIKQMIDKDCQRFAFTLIDKILIPADPAESLEISIISIILLKNCLRNEKKWRLTSETANIIRQKMLTLMLNNTNHRLESQLQQILKILYKKVSNAQDIQNDLIEIKEQTTTTDPKVQKTLFLTLESLFNTPKSIKNQLASQFEELAVWLIETGNQQTQTLTKESKDVKLVVSTLNQRQNISFFPQKIKSIESWLETVIQVVSTEFPLNKITPELVDLLQSKSYYHNLSTILQDILALDVSFENPDSNALISAPVDTPAHYEINSAKLKALELLTIILERFEKVSSQIDVTKFDFFQAVQNHVLQLVLTSLDSFLNGEVYRELCENEESGEVDEIISYCGVFLQKAAAFEQLYQAIDFSIPDLLMRCILPLLRTPPSEIERCQDASSSIEYVNILFDICFEQKLQDKRSAFAGFLNTMISNEGNNDDGKMTALKLLLNLAEFSIAPDFENYPELAQYEELNFLSEVQPESRLEICLLTLASLHKNLDNNMKKMIGEFMQKHYSNLIESSSMEIKVNLCFFIACYSEIILKTSDLGADCFRFILESVNIKDEESACLIQAAAKTLQILFKNNSLSGFLIPYAMDTLKVLTEIFLENPEESFMNVILEILSNYELQILEEPDFLVEFLKTLIAKIEEGLQKENCVGDENVKLGIMRNLLQKIFEKKQYILMIQKDLEDVIQPLLTLLQELHINSKQNIIKDRHLLSLLIPLLPAVKNFTQILLSNISQASPLVVEITHSLNYLFLKLSDIIKDSDAIVQFNKTPQTVQILIEIIIKALHQKSGFDRSELICQGALLFQLIFQYVDSLGASHVENILETTCQLLKSSVNPQIRVQLLCVILNALHTKFEISQALLLKLDALNYFINSLLENLLNFDDFSYCRQVLIIGLSGLLNQPNLLQEIQSRLPELFNVVISFVQTQQLVLSKAEGGQEKIEKFEYKSEQILLKKFLENQDIIEEEQIIQTNENLEQEDEDQEENEENNEVYIANRPIDKLVDVDFKTEFKKKNALEFFKNEISLFQQKNAEFLQNISERKKTFIDNLLKK